MAHQETTNKDRHPLKNPNDHGEGTRPAGQAKVPFSGGKNTAGHDEFTKQTSEETDFETKKKVQGFEPSSGVAFTRNTDDSGGKS